MSRQLRPQLVGVRVHDNVIRGKLKSHLLPCLSPAPSPGPRAESWVDICNAETKSGRVQNIPEPDLDLSQLIIIRHCRKVYSEIFDMLLWFGLLCHAAEPRTQHGDTGHQTEVRLLRHASTRHRHRLARARRNNSRLALGNYEMNAAIVGPSSRSKNQTAQ